MNRRLTTAFIIASLLAAPVAPARAGDAEAIAALEAIADDPKLPFPPEVVDMEFREAYDFADKVNRSTMRRLMILHQQGFIELPYMLLDAFRFKIPGLFNRRGR